MTEVKLSCRPPPVSALRSIFDHQRWLTSNGRFGKRLVREALEFENCDLAGVDLTGAHLAFASFVGGTLKGARFVGADLSNARFISCDIEGANFTGAQLGRAVFLTNHEAATFDGASFDETAWSEAEAAKIRHAINQRIANSTPGAEPR
jgi:uncharacterized protein YjbI with pentapeptide repeats